MKMGQDSVQDKKWSNGFEKYRKRVRTILDGKYPKVSANEVELLP